MHPVDRKRIGNEVTATRDERTGGKRLARNAVVNLIGLSAPLPVALLAIPLLIEAMGTERFGFLTVSWVVIGYFGLFDLGLGRALTKAVAERLGGDLEEEIPAVTATALVLMLALGTLGAVVLAGLAGWLVSDVLTISPEIQGEALRSFYLLAFSLPWVIGTAGLRGLLEANQSFGIVNAMRVPMGLFNYLGPLLVLPFSNSLSAVITVLVIGRVIACVAHLIACFKVFPTLRTHMEFHGHYLPELIRIGGWMTVSSVVSPLMTYVDRFLIGALISMTAVAYYVTPFEVVTKLLLVPSALVGVLFPAVATVYARDRHQATRLMDRAVRVVFLLIFPVVVVIVAFADEGLTLWLGSDFAAESTAVLRWLAVGVLINSLAYIPSTALHGIGRPDITGKLHLAELPLYIGMIWVLGERWGIEGIAIAWVLRVALDTVFLFAAASRFLPNSAADLRRTGQMVFVALAIVALATLDAGLIPKVAALLTFLSVFGVIGWFRILGPAERALVRG